MSKYGGTQVPNAGYVENIYFNTNLSVDEVVSICETLNFVPFNEYDDIWSCFSTNDMSLSIMIIRNSYLGFYRYSIAFVDYVKDERTDIFDSYLGVADSLYGWADFVSSDGIYLGIDNYLFLVASSFNFTPENEKAVDLFSITPFGSAEESSNNVKVMNLNNPPFVASEVGLRTITYTFSSLFENAVVENGKKIIKAGTLYPSNDENALGIVYQDIDITEENKVDTLMVGGVYLNDKLNETISSSAKSKFEKQGLYGKETPIIVIPDEGLLD